MKYSNNYERLFKLLFAFIIHIFLLFFIFRIVQNFNTFSTIKFSLSQWDVGWYKSIVDNGYVFKENQQSNLAFYPLFPYVWKFLGFNYLQISIFNAALLVLSIILIYIYFQIDLLELLFLMSFPSVFFCYVPYTESLFFISSTMLLIGLYKEKIWLSTLGIFIASLTRSASLIFMPVIVLCMLLELNKEKSNNIRVIGKYMVLLIASFLASFIVFYIQYVQTGKFFAIFDVLKYWGKELRIPQFPLTTWMAPKLLWLDGLAFFVGLVAFVLVGSFIFNKIKNQSLKVNSAFVFSAGYIAVVNLYVLSYAELADKCSSIYSLNRYIFATAFFSIFVLYLLRNTKIDRAIKRIFWGLVVLSLLIFGLPKFVWEFRTNMASESRLINIAILVGFSILFFFLIKVENRKPLMVILYIINVVLQVFAFLYWLSGMWIG